MNGYRIIPIVVILVVTATAGAQFAASTDVSTSKRTERLDEARTAHLVHEYVNEERTERGLDPLEYDSDLASVATTHSQDMAERNSTTHVSADGRSVAERYDQAGYQCDAVTGGNATAATPETVGQTTVYTPIKTDRGQEFINSERELARVIVNAWMQSDDQRDRLLQPSWRVDGVGVEIRSDDTAYVTQNYC